MLNNICIFCNSYAHTNKECNLEKSLAPYLKKNVGRFMEFYISNNFCCPKCKTNSLLVLDNNTPSLDIVCKNCNQIIEVKSKCISASIVPKDIYCFSGNYNKFLNNINNGLNLIIVIYGVDRKLKEITIRQIYYISNEKLQNNNIIEIKKKQDSSSSIIFIKNRMILDKIIINVNKIISFDNCINILQQKLYIK